MKIKFNWGIGITIFISAFILLNIIFIIFAFGQRVDLVTEKYYEKELKYQEVIDKKQNSSTLFEELNINFDNENLYIKFPSQFSDKEISGKIFFYRPSDSFKDFSVDITTAELKQVIPIKNIQKGSWIVQVDWNAKDNHFFDEKRIYVE
ncbi:MAG: hypothetical protein STSR0008_14620 [Ignavibacterium sp.]